MSSGFEIDGEGGVELPLAGWRVVVTRARHQAEETCRLLEARGAWPLRLPTIAIVEHPDAKRLDQALTSAARYDYLIVTSTNTVRQLAAALRRTGLGVQAFAGVQVCAVGSATAAALTAIGLRPDRMPDDHRAEGLLAMLNDVLGKRALLPRAEVAREILPDTLRQRGMTVDVIPVYRAGLPSGDDIRKGLATIEVGGADAILFSSAATVKNFAALVGDGARLEAICGALVVAAISPVTEAACEELGVTVDVLPKEAYTLSSLIDALVEYRSIAGPKTLPAAGSPPAQPQGV